MDVLSLLACSYLLVHSSFAAQFVVPFDEGLSEIYPANNPLEASVGDTVFLVCNVTGDIYRYETIFEFTACVTQTSSPLRIATCSQGLIDIGFRHNVEIINSPSLFESRYVPGTTYYFVGYSDPNMASPSGAPCDNGVKMAIHILSDGRGRVSTTGGGGGSSVGGTGGLSPSDSPLLDTTQIIIVAVSVSIGLLVICGVVLLIGLLFFLSCRSSKQDLESPAASNESVKKDSIPKRATKEKRSPKTNLGKTEESPKADIGNWSSNTRVAGKGSALTAPKINLGKTGPVPRTDIVKGSSKTPVAGNGSAVTAPKTKTGPVPRTDIGKGSSKAGNGSAVTAVSYSKNYETISVDGPRNQRSGSKSQQPSGAGRRLPSVQAADRNDKIKPIVGAGNRVRPSNTRASIDNDRDAMQKKTDSVGNPNVSRVAANRAGGAANVNGASGASTRLGSVSGKVATRQPPKPPVPSQSLDPTTRKNSSSVPNRPLQSLTSHS